MSGEQGALAEEAAPDDVPEGDVPAPVPEAEFYDNCDEARADGAAPVHEGDPGYGSHLDRDGDGVGCE